MQNNITYIECNSVCIKYNGTVQYVILQRIKNNMHMIL